LKKINDQVLSFKIALTNNFLIKLSGGYLLVDTNYYHKYEQFLKELKSEKISPGEISYLLLTHHHDDHAGFAKRFLLTSQARLIVHNNAIPFLKMGIHDNRGKHWNKWIQQMLDPLSKIINHKYPGLKVRKEDLILEGNCLKNSLDFRLDGKIISTPGHSSDSISIVFNDGNAIVGDVAMNLFNLGETKYRPFFIQDINELYRSWRKLRFGAIIIFPAHGKPFAVDKLSKKLSVIKKEELIFKQEIFF